MTEKEVGELYIRLVFQYESAISRLLDKKIIDQDLVDRHRKSFYDSLDEEKLRAAQKIGDYTEIIRRYVRGIICEDMVGASEELIRFVIEKTGAHDATYTSLNDYYKQLCCYHMHFKAIPQRVYYKVIREYIKIFRKRYSHLISEIKSSIALKNDEMRHIANQIDRITHSSNIDLRITKNIKDTEQTLFTLSQKCENLQVQKEMLIFSLDYLNECMAKFCNLDNKAEVLKALRNIALDIATERIRDVASKFQYYDEVSCPDYLQNNKTKSCVTDLLVYHKTNSWHHCQTVISRCLCKI